MSKTQQPAVESILDLNSNNIWDVTDSQIVTLWEQEREDEDFPPHEEKLLNVIRLAFEVVHFNPEDEREEAKYCDGTWATFARTDSRKGLVAIRHRAITRLSDLSYENIKHVSAPTVLELIDRNFGGGWESIPLSVRDIIESGFDISTTTLPASRLHMQGGTRDKKIADGYDVLEVPKGTWIEAIFAKKRAPAVKLRSITDQEYDEEGNRRHPSDDDEDVEEVTTEAETEDEDEEVQPAEDDTFYSSYAPEAEVKDDDDDETSGLSVLEE